MKISTERWDEWFSAPITDSVSAESELSGIVACMKSRSEGGSVVLSLPRLWVFRRFRRLWPKVTWSADCELNDILRVRSRHVSLLLPVELYRKILARSRRADFIRWTWARGVYGCTGSIYNPRRGYYCLMRFHSKTVFLSVKELLDGSGITCSYRENGGVWELSIRDLQHIMRFCYFIGLESVASALEEQSMMRSSRDLANKQANCDSANTDRILDAAGNQIEAINRLKASGRLEQLPYKLREMAELRVENPEASLTELGEMLEPPLKKSGVNNRLKKLMEAAAEIG